MQKDFTICLVKCFLFSFLTCFMILKDASSSSGPQCEIICKLNDSAKDEETVDPDSKVPFNCSIENRGATTQNTTWKQLYRTVTPTDSQPCMVLKEGNSERQIYLARALTVARPGSPKIIHENIGKNLSCEFEGRPRPFITWYVDGKPIKSEFEELGHTELETSQDDGIFKVTSTLYLPGREKFNGLSFTCSGTNSLTSGWSSSANETISVRFKCIPFVNISRVGLRAVWDASSAGDPQCEIICKLSGSAKDKETVDPDSKVPFNCSIRNGGATTRNTTWKQLYRTVTAPADGQPCMVLKTGNSERQIYLARALTVAKPGSPRIIYENIGENVSCEFEGRPRPFITWYIGGKSIMSEFEELETLQHDGSFKVTSTLYIPGLKKFDRLNFTCSGTNKLSSGWSSSASQTGSIRFKCLDVIKANGSQEIQVNSFNNITLRCLVSRVSTSWCLRGFTWHFNKNPEPLKTDGKYVIVKFEKIKSVCKTAFSLEILNVTEDDEGEYSCHQICRTFTGWNNQSDSIKMKVYSPPPSSGEWVIVNRSGSPKYISQNQGVDIYCAFKGRPRPQITWYKDDEPIINESESLRHEELEQSGEDGTLITYTTLHVPGREEFDGVYKCAANSSFNNSWSTSKNSKIQVKFLCNKDTSIRANTPLEIKENALKNITLSCLVRWDASDRCQGFAWHFKNNSVSLKTDEKYKIVEFEETDSICYDAYKLEITNITGEDEGEYSCHQSCQDDVNGWLNSSVKIQLKVLSDISTTNDYTPASILKLTTVGRIFNTPQATSSEKWILATVIPIVGVLVFVLLAVTGCIKKRKPYIIFPRQCPRLLEVTEETAF